MRNFILKVKNVRPQWTILLDYRPVLGVNTEIAITLQFSAIGGFMRAHISDDGLCKTGFNKRLSLVSLCLGQLGVNSHQRSFDLAI